MIMQRMCNWFLRYVSVRSGGLWIRNHSISHASSHTITYKSKKKEAHKIGNPVHHSTCLHLGDQARR